MPVSGGNKSRPKSEARLDVREAKPEHPYHPMKAKGCYRFVQAQTYRFEDVPPVGGTHENGRQPNPQLAAPTRPSDRTMPIHVERGQGMRMTSSNAERACR